MVVFFKVKSPSLLLSPEDVHLYYYSAATPLRCVCCLNIDQSVYRVTWLVHFCQTVSFLLSDLRGLSMCFLELVDTGCSEMGGILHGIVD